MPNKKKLDKDTQKVFNEGQQLADFVKSEAWQLIKKKFINKIMLNDSMMSVIVRPGASNEEVMREVVARAQATKLCLDWLTEIEGTAAQFEDNKNQMMAVHEEQILAYFPERSQTNAKD